MEMTFDTAIFRQRRQRLLETFNSGVIILPAAHEATRSKDTEFPFRQDSDFQYITGFPEPDAIAVLRPGNAKPFLLFVREKDREREIWTGFRAGPEGAMETYGADEAYPLSEWPKMLPDLLAGAGEVLYGLGRDRELERQIVDIVADMSRKGRQGIEAPATFLDPGPTLAEMRLFKGPEEIPLLQKACDITAAGHIAAMRETRPGMFEYEVQALIEYQFRKRGAAYPGYGTIVAGGANATVLHYVENAMPLQDNTLLLIDAGAEFQGYTGDVTRAFPVGRKFEGAARDVYDIVLRAQLAAIEATRPGATVEGIHDITCKVLTEGLVSLGILQGDVDQLMADKAYRPYYMHRTSHWLGMDVHDVGAYTRKGQPRPLEPGMVLTIEPGLYFHADNPASAKFHGIGVRIEDDILVTLKGHRNLTAAVPKAIADIEALRDEAFDLSH
jgi:Xaa-Pro aminopeptidase